MSTAIGQPRAPWGWLLLRAFATVLIEWPLKLTYRAGKTSLSLFAIGVGVTVRQTLFGRHRGVAAPAWLLVFSVGSLWWADSAWCWVGAACVLAWVPERWWDRLKRRRLSTRERALVADTFALIAAVVATLRPSWVAVASLAVVVTGAAPLWWAGRRVRPESPMLLRWRTEVVPHVPALDGTWIEFDEATSSGVLQLSQAKASQVANLDEDAEWALHQPHGTVTISADPRLSVRCVRVAFTEPGNGGRMRFVDGPTLGKDGRFTVMHAKGGMAMRAPLWGPDGSRHIAVVAPTGAGKGSIQRLIAFEAALSPEVFLIGVDGKRGKGIGYLRSAFGYMATRPDDWEATIAGVLAEVERREDDDSTDDDSFVVRPGRPRILLMIDELPKVLRHAPRVGDMLQQIAARGRSLGVGLCLAMQKGDGPSYGATETRSNVLDGGWLWAGPATDAQAKVVMLQSFPFDPTTLPQEPGWAAIMGRALGSQPIVPGRTLWLPNRLDVAKAIEAGVPESEACPFGTVEDWLERDAIHPVLEPAAMDVLGLVGQDAADGDAEDVTRLADVREIDRGDVWSRIKKVLADGPEEGMLRGEIADLAGCSRRHASELLASRRAKEPAEVIQDAEQRWRLAS